MGRQELKSALQSGKLSTYSTKRTSKDVRANADRPLDGQGQCGRDGGTPGPSVTVFDANARNVWDDGGREGGRAAQWAASVTFGGRLEPPSLPPSLSGPARAAHNFRLTALTWRIYRVDLSIGRKVL